MFLHGAGSVAGALCCDRVHTIEHNGSSCSARTLRLTVCDSSSTFHVPSSFFSFVLPSMASCADFTTPTMMRS